MTIPVDENIVRLDVAMNKAKWVDILKRTEKQISFVKKPLCLVLYFTKSVRRCRIY